MSAKPLTGYGMARILKPVTWERLFNLHGYAFGRALREPDYPHCLSQRVTIAIWERMATMVTVSSLTSYGYDMPLTEGKR